MTAKDSDDGITLNLNVLIYIVSFILGVTTYGGMSGGIATLSFYSFAGVVSYLGAIPIVGQIVFIKYIPIAETIILDAFGISSTIVMDIGAVIFFIQSCVISLVVVSLITVLASSDSLEKLKERRRLK